MKQFITFFMALWSLDSFADLSTELVVSKVYNSKTNQYATGVPATSSCSVFKGTYQGNSIALTPMARGGSGKYDHRLVWQVSESYKTFDLTRMQKEAYVKDGKSFILQIPELKDDIPYLQQSVFLISRDKRTGKSATSQLIFNVSRPVILSHTNKPEKMELNCYQVFPAYESISGILSNGSTNPSQLIIRQGIQSIWSKTNGSQWGYYISPLSWTVVGNVLSFYRNYFTQFSRQTIETVEVSNGYTIAPGDFIQLYEQRTRYVSAFDIFEVNECGETNEVDGSHFMQWWGRAYHAVPVNPYDSEPVPRELIGITPTNNCPDELTPEFARENTDYIFTKTN